MCIYRQTELRRCFICLKFWIYLYTIRFLKNKKIDLVDKIQKMKKKNNKCMVAFFCPLRASYMFLIKYVNMRDTFVDMQDNYVKMQH